MTTEPLDHYRICNACKKPIGFSVLHYVCSVSTCTRKRTGMVFCSVSCWETHVPVLRHRDAWAVEARSPTREQWAREQAEDDDKPIDKSTDRSSNDRSGARIVAPTSTASAMSDEVPEDILIVVSKLKQYIRARSGMNTSDNVMPALSAIVRRLCDEAIREAGRDDRKTVMDRDFKARE